MRLPDNYEDQDFLKFVSRLIGTLGKALGIAFAIAAFLWLVR